MEVHEQRVEDLIDNYKREGGSQIHILIKTIAIQDALQFQVSSFCLS
jgi:hypothetical protein